MASVTGNVAEDLHRDFLGFICLGAHARTINILKIRERFSGWNRRTIHRGGIPCSRKDDLVAFPVIHIRLRESERHLAILGNVCPHQDFIHR